MFEFMKEEIEMKYIFVDEDDVIFHISETKGYQENGNVLVDDGRLAIPPSLIKEIYELGEVPEEIEVAKYCYTEENGFYKNENYREYFSEEERISALEDAVNLLLGF